MFCVRGGLTRRTRRGGDGGGSSSSRSCGGGEGIQITGIMDLIAGGETWMSHPKTEKLIFEWYLNFISFTLNWLKDKKLIEEKVNLPGQLLYKKVKDLVN